MTNDTYYEFVKKYLDKLINENNPKPVKIGIKLLIELSWGLVYGYNTQSYMDNQDHSFLVGNYPILYNKLNGEIIQLGGRKKNNLDVLSLHDADSRRLYLRLISKTLK